MESAINGSLAGESGRASPKRAMSAPAARTHTAAADIRWLPVVKSLPAALSLSVLAFTAGWLAGCGPRQAGLFPESNEVPGWSSAGKMRTFKASSLWQYIDGGAEKYIQAGVERTLTADYRYQDGLDAVADVYIMGTREGARTILESEPTSDSRPAELGDEGRLYSNSLVFRRGRYMVRLTAYRDAPNAGTALVLLGRGIERRIERQH